MEESSCQRLSSWNCSLNHEMVSINHIIINRLQLAVVAVSSGTGFQLTANFTLIEQLFLHNCTWTARKKNLLAPIDLHEMFGDVPTICMLTAQHFFRSPLRFLSGKKGQKFVEHCVSSICQDSFTTRLLSCQNIIAKSLVRLLFTVLKERMIGEHKQGIRVSFPSFLDVIQQQYKC